MPKSVEEVPAGTGSEQTSASERTSEGGEAPGPGPQSPGIAETVSAWWVEIQALAGFYLRTRIDRVRSAVATALLWTAVGLALGVVGLAITATAAVLLVVGASQVLAIALPTPGIAPLIVGGGILIMVSGAVLIVAAFIRSGRRQRLAARYDEYYRRQRAELGADVSGFAGRAGDEPRRQEARS